MKKLITSGALLVGLLAAGASSAVVNPPVSIAYPISGSANNNYFKVSFTVTCPGGMHTVKWAFDTTNSVGAATFYDNFNTQFLHKLPSGWHTIDVVSTCGQEHMKFYVN
ncbi:MAG TPA: hypothetical protein VJV79_00670 [Polyangiaceae bacterium]|nr:hypothetical protein [Polyangiaceae bacterium]